MRTGAVSDGSPPAKARAAVPVRVALTAPRPAEVVTAVPTGVSQRSRVSQASGTVGAVLVGVEFGGDDVGGVVLGVVGRVIGVGP